MSASPAQAEAETPKAPKKAVRAVNKRSLIFELILQTIVKAPPIPNG
jgi:hypothetical protein